MQIFNCWDFKKCGREPGGKKTAELGVCPAATETRTNGINAGRNGGRACWAIGGTLCDGQQQGVYATKLKLCMECDFYQLVRDEEESRYISSTAILEKLR